MKKKMKGGPGRVQRKLLDLMERNGGIWPPQWIIHRDHTKSFDSLLRRGLIRRVRTEHGTTYGLVR